VTELISTLSYDLQVWTVLPPQCPSVLPGEGWERSASAWTVAKPRWQVVVQEPVNVELEDVPSQVVSALPGVAFLTEIHLEPYGAPSAARSLATKAASAIAKASHGAVVDEQAETLKLPRGIKRYRREPGGPVDLLTMSWWYEGDQLSTTEGLEGLVGIIETMLPELLPRRYGLWEPPQFKLADHSREHLVSFLHEHGHEFVIWYPSLPALGVSWDPQERVGFAPRGFVTHHLQIDFDRAALSQPGWAVALRRFWEALSLQIEPFYGDVRTLRGYERQGSRLWVPGGAEDHPVQGPFWDGIPPGPVHGLVIGEPYASVWRDVPLKAERKGNLFFASCEDWQSADDALDLVGGLPSDIAASSRPLRAGAWTGLLEGTPDYPETWPFPK
jgi:hypothetical protein